MAARSSTADDELDDVVEVDAFDELDDESGDASDEVNDPLEGDETDDEDGDLDEAELADIDGDIDLDGDLGSAEIDATIEQEDLDDLDPDEFSVVVAAATDTFDEEDLAPAVGVRVDDDEDGLREGEFVCRSCYMAKRETQLADPKSMRCRDCA